jgi:SAM-dependent methyltransferase
MLRSFFALNRRASQWVARRLPHAQDDLFARYEEAVVAAMNERPGQVVIDVGGGKTCPFTARRRPALGTRVFGVDVDRGEIARNREVDAATIGDASRGLPFADRSVDVIASRMVIEHLPDLEPFVADAVRVLRPGGRFIHLFPSRYAPFAVLNRIVPQTLAKRILYFFQRGSPFFPEGNCGFRAFYRDCHDSAFRAILARHGFELVEVRPGYYQSFYFDFFLPLYLLSAAYELLVRGLGLRDLAAYLLVVARKP